MNVRNGIENLSQIPASQSAQVKTVPKNSQPASSISADTAQVSAVGAQAVQSAGESDVRLDKVASIQAALQAGTYRVPASAVAQKVIGALLTSDQ